MTDLLDPRVVALFDEIAELPREDRRKALEERCGDEELRQRVLDLLACNTPSGMRGAATLHTLEESIGTRIGPYEIVALLGEGGMGTVYLAEQKEPLQRRVALKIIKLGMDTRRVIARFEVERQVLALLDHRNIARVLDAGATERGRPYFVMELVEGEPLTRYCDARALDVRGRLELFLAVCRGVQHAHHRGVIHRDLKPGNVLVREVEGEAVPKIIDFGVAKATRPEAEVTKLTEHQQILGTPDYMSPEQAGHGDREVDTRSDIFSLGVLLYELLTGTTPYTRPTDYAEVATPSRRLETLPDRVEEIAEVRASTPRALRKHLRDGLDWIALKCLEKEKGRRYESAAALARDVERYLADEPLSAGPPDLSYRVRKFVKRHRTGLGITAVVTIAFLVVVAGFLNALLDKSVEEREARKKAEAALRANRIERGRLLGMTGNLNLAEELLWGEYLDEPSAEARWALWEFYWGRPCLATQDVAGSRIYTVDFQPGAPVLATGQRSGIVRLWNVQPLRCFAALEGHKDAVRGLAYLPNGVLATASVDGTIRLWDTATGAQRRVLRSDAGFQCLDRSPDGRWLATGDADGRVHLWEVATGRLLDASEAAGTGRRSLIFDRTGHLIIAGREDGVIDLINVDPRAPKLVFAHELVGHTREVSSLALDPKGRRLYSGSRDRTARLWNVATRTCLKTVRPGVGAVLDIDLVGGDDLFLLGDWAVERWSADLEHRYTTVRVPRSSSMDRSGRHLCIVGVAERSDGQGVGRLRLFETDPGRAVVRKRVHTGIAYALAVSPGTGDVLTAGSDGRVRLGERMLGKHDAQVNAAAFTPDGRHLATGDRGGEVRMWDVETGSILARRRGFSTAGKPLAMAPAGDRFVTGRQDGTITVWAIPSGEPIAEHRVSTTEVVWLAFSPDGRRLASAARDHAVRIWNARDLRRLEGLVPVSIPWSLAFSPDGATLAVGSWDQTIHLWDLKREERVGILKGHHGLVRDIVFAPARLRKRLGLSGLVSASGDGTLKLWDVDTRKCVLTLPCGEAAYSVAFLDGPRLVSTHGLGTLATWDLAYYDRHIEGNRAHQERLRASRRR